MEIDAIRTLSLVRHGESTWNELGLIQGQADDASLTEKGRRQAEVAAEHLAHRSIEAVFSSDLGRAVATAEIVAHRVGRPVSSDPSLRERNFGVHEGLPLDTLDRQQTGIEGERIIDASARPEGGESLQDVYDRVSGFIDWLAHHEGTGDLVVVAHGGSIRAIRAYCAGIPARDMVWDVVANGSVWDVPLPPAAAPFESNQTTAGRVTCVQQP